MANTFKIDTKSSVVTDAHTSSNANVLTAGGSATLVLLSILVSNKTGASTDADVFLAVVQGLFLLNEQILLTLVMLLSVI